VEKNTLNNSIQAGWVEAQVKIKRLIGVNNIKILRSMAGVKKSEVKAITVNTNNGMSSIKAVIMINERYVPYETDLMHPSEVDVIVDDLYKNTEKYAVLILSLIK